MNYYSFMLMDNINCFKVRLISIVALVDYVQLDQLMCHQLGNRKHYVALYR